MNNTVPHFIIEQNSKKAKNGVFDAYVLFADISGFTELTRRSISGRGKGIEELTDTINAFFDSIIDAVYMNGGWVGNFAGDAVTAYFPERSSSDAVNAARMITYAFTEAHIKDMSVRVVLSYGKVEWMIFESSGRFSYAFFGEPLSELSEKCFQPVNTIRAAKSFVRNAPEQPVRRLNDTDYIDREGIIECSYFKNALLPSHNGQNVFEDIRIAEREIMGEFRHVASVFINIGREGARVFIEALMALIEENEGYLNKIDTGDKGTMILVLFGAPRALKNPSEAALKFALSAISMRKDASIGVSYGTVYAGFMGSGMRMEFTVMGDSVNMAARYCMKAGKWRVLTDRKCADAGGKHFIFKNAGMFEIKGCKSRAELLRPEINTSIDEVYIERKGVDDALEELLNEKKFTEIHILGEPGTGKSMLLKRMSSLKNLLCLSCRRNSAYSLQPFIDYLRRSSYIKMKTAERKKMFMECDMNAKEASLYAAALDALLDSGKPGRAAASLSKTELNALSLEALALYISCEAGKRGALAVDNSELLDEESLKMLKAIHRRDEGKVFIFAEREETRNTVSAESAKINARRFTEEETTALISSISANADSISESVFRSSKGLPQYIPYFVKYFDGQNRSMKSKKRLKIDIETCLLSFADSMPIETMGMLRRLSVFVSPISPAQLKMLFGKGFDELQSENDLKGIISVENGLIGFKDERMKSAIYGTILHKDLRSMHKEAADSVMTAEESPEKYIEAAYHFRQSGRRELALLHTERAADYFKGRLMMSDSLKQRLLLKKYLKTESERRKNDLVCAEAYFHIGRYKNAESLCRSAMKSAEIRQAASYTLSNILMRTGRQKEAEQLLKEIVKHRGAGSRKEVRNSYNSLGVLHLNRHEWQKALNYFAKSSALSRRMDDKKGEAMSHMNKALVYMESGNADKALKIYEGARHVFEEDSDIMEIGRIEGNVGQIYYLKGEYRKAYDCFKRKYDISVKLGYRRGIGIAMGNMGAALIGMKQYARAEKMLLKKAEMDKKAGNPKGLEVTYDNLYELYVKTGRMKEAEETGKALKELYEVK